MAIKIMSSTIFIPPQFATCMIELYGQVGVKWLHDLPNIIASCEQRWNLKVLPPFMPLSYNYVAPALAANGAELVLKVGVPNPELLTEVAALRLYDGRGIVRLLDVDANLGILLLERLKPGLSLNSLTDDEQATRIAARVMRQLWHPVPPEHPFPTVARWAKGLQRLRERFGGTTGVLPPRLFEMAEGLFMELLESMGEEVLLHGDLHHANILSAEREPWLAIDPKGIVGEAAYEVGAFLRNPMPDLLRMPHPRRLLARRIKIFAEELALEPKRLAGWGMAQAVLSACWSLEDHAHGWQNWITCGEWLAEILQSGDC